MPRLGRGWPNQQRAHRVGIILPPAQTITLTSGIPTGERISGINFLPDGQSTFENGVDTAKFFVFGVAIAQSSAQALDGTKSMSVTSGFTGSISVEMGSFGGGAGGMTVGATAGQTCSGMFWIRPQNNRTTISLGLRWYNDVGATISSPQIASGTANSGVWTQFVGNAVAPAGTVSVGLTINYDHVNGEVDYVDQLGIFDGVRTTWQGPGPQVNLIINASSIATSGNVPAPVLQYSQFITASSIASTESFGNVLTPNMADLETGTTGWSGVGGTVAWINNDGDHGSGSIEFTTGAGANPSAAIGAATGSEFLADPGETWSFVVSVKAMGATLGFQVKIAWYDASHAFINQVAPSFTSTSSWVSRSASGVAPANTVYAVPFITFTGTPGAGNLHRFDRAALYKGSVRTDWEMPAPLIGLFITANSIGTAESVPSPSVQFIIGPTSIVTAESVPSATILGGAFSQSITVVSIPKLTNTMGGNLLTEQQSKIQTGMSYGGNQSVVVRSTLRPFIGTGMMQLQVPRTNNLLTANQASVETDTTGFSTGVNCALTQTAAQASDGTASLQLTCNAVAPPYMASYTLQGTSGHPVFADTQYTAVVDVRAASTVRSAYVQMDWYDSAGAYIVSSLGTGSNDSAAAWGQRTVTANSPATAAYVSVAAVFSSPANGEVHYADKFAIFHGTTTTWAVGGNYRNQEVINSSGYSSYQCSPSTSYTMSLQGWQMGSAAGSQSQARAFFGTARFYDSGGVFITQNNTTFTGLSTSAWTQSTSTFTSPSNAAFVILGVAVQPNPSGAVNMLPGELFYIDGLSFRTTARPVGFDNVLEFRGNSATAWSIPQYAGNTVTGDLDVTLYLRMTDWSPALESIFAGQYNIAGLNRNWLVYQAAGSAGAILFSTSVNGTSNTTTSWTPGWVDGSWHWLRITHDIDDGANQNVVRIYTRTLETDPWALQFTDNRAGAIAGRFAATAPITLGAYSPTNSTMAGAIAYFELKSGIAELGTDQTVALFDARFRSPDRRRSVLEWPAGPNLGNYAVDFDFDISGWSGNFGTLKKVPVNGADDYSAMRFTATSAAAAAGPFTPAPANSAPVVPGRTYTTYAYMTKGIGNHTVSARLNWRDAAGAFLSSDLGTATALTAAPQLYQVTAVAPANAAYAMINVYTTTTMAIGDSFDIGRVGVFEGAGMWTPSSTSATAGWGWEPALGSKWFTFEPDGQFIHLNRDGSCYLSTPDVAAVRITGDIDVRAFGAPDVLNAGIFQGWASKDGVNTNSGWWFRVTLTGDMEFGWSPDGTNTYKSGSAVLPTAYKVDGRSFGSRATLDVDNGIGGWTLTLYASFDGVKWNQIGQTTGAGVTSIFNSTQPLEIGRMHSASHYQAGKIEWVEVRKGINGEVVAAFDASMVTITGGQLPTTVSTQNGANWTVNGTGWLWSPAEALGVEPYWVPYSGTPDVRRSTIAPPDGAEGFAVMTTSREINTNYAEFTSASVTAGSVIAGETYVMLQGQRLPVPLPARTFYTHKINWNSAGGYINQSNSTLLSNSNGGSAGHWVIGGGGGPVVAGADRAGLQPLMGNEPLSGEVYFMTEPGFWHADEPNSWEPGSGTTVNGEGGPMIRLTLPSVTSIGTAANVPSPAIALKIYPAPIRSGQNSVRLDNGAYMTAPGDNLVSSVMASYEPGSSVQGISGIPQGNQCTLSYVTGGYPNMLTSNEAGIETDGTGWTNTNNCASARSTAQALDGTASLSITASSAADMSIKNTNQKAITSGRTYTARVWFRAATAGRSCRAQINWRTSGGSLIASSAGTPVSSTTSGWTEAVCTASPPDSGAANATIEAYVLAPGNGEVHYIDRISLTDDTVPVGAVDGLQCARVQSSGGASWGPYEHVRGAVGTTVFVAAGTQYTLSGWLTQGVGSYSVQARIEWRDSSFNTISTSAGTAVVLSGAPQLASITATAPANTTNATVTFYATTTGVAGDYYYVDKVCFRAGASTTFLDAYHPGLDLDVRIGFIPDRLVTSTAQCLIGKYDITNNKRSWILEVNPDSSLLLKFSQDGTTAITAQSTATLASVGFADARECAVKATLQVNSGGVNRVTTFYYSLNNGGTWTQLGSTVTQSGALTAGLYRSNVQLIIGNQTPGSGTEDIFEGEILWSELLDSINGGRVFSFDAASVDATAPQIPITATAA